MNRRRRLETNIINLPTFKNNYKKYAKDFKIKIRIYDLKTATLRQILIFE